METQRAMPEQDKWGVGLEAESVTVVNLDKLNKLRSRAEFVLVFV